MIRLIVLLFTIIHSTKRCEEKVFTTRGQLQQILYEVSVKFRGKVNFVWQMCGKSVPTSKYLPIRAGTSTGNTKFEVVASGRGTWMKGKVISKYSIPNYRMLFYIYVSGENAVVNMVIRTRESQRIYIQQNDKTLASLKSCQYYTCPFYIFVGCKTKRYYWRDVIKQITMSMLNGWNQIKFINIMWTANYLFRLKQNNAIRHRSFIPWNTTLPNACAMRDKYVAQHLNKVKHFELDMDYTYGQTYALKTVIACFKKIALYNHVNITINATYIKRHKIAKFEVQGNRSAQNGFYKLLVDRTKSAECIEYVCIHWSMNMIVPTHSNTNVPTHSNTNAPTHSNTNVPTHSSTNAPTHSNTNAPTHSNTNAPTHSNTNAPTHSNTNVPTHSNTNAPTHSNTNAPTHSNTNAPTHSNTNAPKHNNTNAPTHSNTNAPTHTLTKQFANITTHDRSNSTCTTDTAIAMAYPHSINMIKVQLATNKAHSYMHLTTCLQDILEDQYKLISVDKVNESNDIAAIYIKPGGVAATVVEKGAHNCYTSILLICQNTNILTKLRNKEHLRIILIIFLSVLTFIVIVLIVYLTRRFVSKKRKKKRIDANDIEAAIHTAFFDHLESKAQMNTKTPNKNIHTYDHVKELTDMHTIHKKRNTLEKVNTSEKNTSEKNTSEKNTSEKNTSEKNTSEKNTSEKNTSEKNTSEKRNTSEKVNTSEKNTSEKRNTSEKVNTSEKNTSKKNRSEKISENIQNTNTDIEALI